MGIDHIGVTPYQEDSVVILSQDMTSVTVALQQMYTSPEENIDYVFYNYHTDLFNMKCYEEENVPGRTRSRSPLSAHGTVRSLYSSIGLQTISGRVCCRRATTLKFPSVATLMFQRKLLLPSTTSKSSASRFVQKIFYNFKRILRIA